MLPVKLCTIDAPASPAMFVAVLLMTCSMFHTSSGLNQKLVFRGEHHVTSLVLFEDEVASVSLPLQ